MTQGINSFKKWARSQSYRRGMICHFYMPESNKQYYGKTDYAYFNLLSNSLDWLVKGTTGHGIKSKRRKSSSIPCLNCFEVDDEFFWALKKLTPGDNTKFELGILLNKRKLRSYFGVIDVSIEWPHPIPSPNKCHYYDNPRFRQGTLYPFNYCNVVRVEIPRSAIHGVHIAPISNDQIMGMLVKRGDYRAITKLLKFKGMEEVEVFPLL